MAELKYEIINHIATIESSKSGWPLELNRISWNGNAPKYDLRSWAPDHQKMGKGVTMTEEELIALSKVLQDHVTLLQEDDD